MAAKQRAVKKQALECHGVTAKTAATPPCRTAVPKARPPGRVSMDQAGRVVSVGVDGPTAGALSKAAPAAGFLSNRLAPMAIQNPRDGTARPSSRSQLSQAVLTTSVSELMIQQLWRPMIPSGRDGVEEMVGARRHCREDVMYKVSGLVLGLL